MAESQGNVSYGIVVDFVPDGGASTFTAEMTDINKDNEVTDQAEVTHQASPDKFKEFLPALTDGGTVTISLNYESDAILPDNQARGELKITLPFLNITLDQMTVKANVATKGAMDAPLGEKLSSEISFKISGKPVWADSTP